MTDKELQLLLNQYPDDYLIKNRLIATWLDLAPVGIMFDSASNTSNKEFQEQLQAFSDEAAVLVYKSYLYWHFPSLSCNNSILEITP